VIRLGMARRAVHVLQQQAADRTHAWTFRLKPASNMMGGSNAKKKNSA